jgi:hypothetical protein
MKIDWVDLVVLSFHTVLAKDFIEIKIMELDVD